MKGLEEKCEKLTPKMPLSEAWHLVNEFRGGSATKFNGAIENIEAIQEYFIPPSVSSPPWEDIEQEQEDESMTDIGSPITIQELRNVTYNLPKDTAPGIDGLSYSHYKNLDPVQVLCSYYLPLI